MSANMVNQCLYYQMEETFIHMLTCNNCSSCKKCRFDALSIKLWKRLSSFFGGTTLLSVIYKWIQHPTTPLKMSAATRDLQLAVNHANESQRNIGWEHLFGGIISLSWGYITHSC
jgi:hypothetical protein